jgi:hypothetical protein
MLTMPVTLRPAEDADVSAMAAIRAQQWGNQTFWTDRITWCLAAHTRHNRLYRNARLLSL